MEALQSFVGWWAANKMYIFITCGMFIAALIFVTGFLRDVTKRFHLKDKARRFGSKMWCHTCWYFEYAQQSRICPQCEARKIVEGEKWLTPEFMDRGQPSKEKLYKEKQRVLGTELD